MRLERLLELPEARKVLGAREIAIVRRQLLGLPLTQSERNRLSRDIRAKFRFIAACRELAPDELELKSGQTIKRIIDKSVCAIQEDEVFPDVLAIVLFGSYADGTAIWRSDVDIGILFREEPSSESGTKALLRLYGELPKKVEVTIINHLPIRIRATLARNHKVLWARSSFDDALFIKSVLEEYGEHQRHLEELA